MAASDGLVACERGGECATTVSVLENDGGEGSEQLSRDAAAATADDDDEDDELLRIGMLLRQSTREQKLTTVMSP